SKAAAPASDIPENSADPTRAVSAPGDFNGTQYGDDLLVVSDKTIPDDEVERLLAITVGQGASRTKGIAAHTRLSYGNFTADGKLYNVAAVDAGQYRAFTGTASAEFQEQWDRIAGGEIAVAASLQKDLRTDGEGYLQVGKQRIHVGAWSPSEVD